jgi:hypothetical protein
MVQTEYVNYHFEKQNTENILCFYNEDTYGSQQ